MAIYGERPVEAVRDRLEALLSLGAPSALPAEVLDYFRRRRAEMTKIAPWVERHYGAKRKRRLG